MKSFIRSLLVIGVLFLSNFISAQTAGDVFSDTNTDYSSASDFEIELKAVESTIPTAATNAPELGTFYSAQNPDSAPLPANINNAPVWNLGNDVFLLSDLDFNYNTSNKRLKAGGSMSAMDLSDSGDEFSPDFDLSDVGTNLWLAITNLSGDTAGILISNTQPDIEYEIQGIADLAGTNWISEGAVLGSELTNWTAASLVVTDYPNLFLRIRSDQDSDGSGLPDWWQLQYFGHLGVDPYGDPDGDGWNNLQEYQNGTNPNSFDTPPAPQGVTVSYNISNGIVTVNWLPSPGPVTGYTVNMKGTNYTVTSNTLSFANSLSTDNPYSDPADYGPTLFANFQVQAMYAGGDSLSSAPVPLEENALIANLVAGPQGLAYLAVSAMPPNTVILRLTRIDEVASEFGDDSFNTNFDIPASSLTNGLYSLSNLITPPDSYVSEDTASFDVWYISSIGSDGKPSASAPASQNYISPQDGWMNSWLMPPYFDGRAQLKQNLIFLLRSPMMNFPFQFSDVYSNFTLLVTNPPAYAYDGFYIFDKNLGYPANFDVFEPFEENYQYRNFVFNSSELNANGRTTTGAGGNYSAGGLILQEPAGYQFQAPATNGALITAVLATNNTRWLASYPLDSSSADLGQIGITFSSPNYTMASDAPNYFGLPFLSAEIANSSGTTTLNAGGSTTQGGYFYPETTQPKFQTVEYDFWRQLTGALPGSGGFSTTNQSDLLITSVGNAYFGVNGYAKLSVQNGYSGVYGYLGQYFDQAYQIDTNGLVTTNTTGILSPYGSFFATQPGPAALVTMPDVDSGERGMVTVYCVSLNVDANHDGNMDLGFNSADVTSQANPDEVWVNNNYDRWKWDADDATNYEDDLGPVDIAKLPAYQQVPDCNYVDAYGGPAIPTTRDLEDYFRFWTPGVATLMKVLPSNYTVQLTLSGSGQIRIFQAVEPDGGTNYLTDETTASNQVANSTSLYVGLLTPSSPIIFNITTNFDEHFIFCGAQVGSAQIDLQILDGNGNVIADAPAFLQINGIKQMYERWTVGEDPGQTPTSVAVKAVDGVTTPFEYTSPTDTNTPYILFVHGWNLETWEKDRFAETAYKRLYWQGYQGRFGSFRWPTAYDFTGSLSDLIFDPKNYDNSEFNAWYSGYGLLSKLNDLNAEYPGNVYLMVHSMGNVVAGEALRLAGTNQVVNTYVAMQGAVPAHCYDASATTRTIPYPFDSGTPNRYAHYYTDTSPNYFNASAGAGTYVNFFNTNDYALGYWQTDQNLKPDTGFSYSGTNFFAGGSEIDFPSATYEIFAYCDEARCFALGAQANVGGAFAISKQVELDGSPYNFGSQHLYHSIEFRLDNSKNTLFWSTLLSKMKLN